MSVKKKKTSLNGFLATVKEKEVIKTDETIKNVDINDDIEIRNEPQQPDPEPQTNLSTISKEPADLLDNNTYFQVKSISEILSKCEMPKIIRSVYIDNDLSQVLDKLSKEGGKGVISEIVNVSIRQYLTEQGVLK